MVRITLLSCVLAMTGAVASAGKIGLPAPTNVAGSWVQRGEDVIGFSGQPVNLRGDNGPAAILVVRSVMFVAKGYQNVGVINSSHPQRQELLGPGWLVREKKDLAALILPGPAPGEIRCRIPEAAVGMVVSFVGARRSDNPPVKLTLNGSTTEFTPLRGPREVLLRLTRQGGGKVRFDKADPVYNLWAFPRREEGVQGDVSTEIDLSPECEPTTSGQYVLHVKYSLDPKDQFKSDAKADVGCIDLTPYDGYVASVKASVPTRSYCNMKTSDNFSWRGGGQVVGSQWTEFAVPFQNHFNATTAGDGVLKLAQVEVIQMNVVPRRGNNGAVEGEFWVKPPRFYTGAPPSGTLMAQTRPVGDQHCNLVTLAPERRTAPYLDGTSIQSISRKGDMVWLGTNKGVIKISRRQPGFAMAQWTQSEGLLDDDVQAIYPDGDQVWIGTVCGLSRFDGKDFQNYTTENGLLPGPVMAIGATPDSLWLGMTRGIARVSKSDGKITPYKRKGGWAPESTGGQGVPVEEGRAVYADSIAVADDGSVWHGAAGVDHTDSSGKPIEHYFGSTSRTIGVYPSGDYVWVVSSRKILCMNKDMKENGRPVAEYNLGQRLGPQQYREDSRIVAACAEKDAIWVAYNDGIGWLAVGQRQLFWSPYCSVALGGLVPQCLMTDEEYLWVGTDNGLVVFNKSDAIRPWTQLDYNCPADIYAAGVDVDADNATDANGTWQRLSLDVEEGAGNAPGSLCLEFDIGKDSTSACSLDQRFGLDLSQYAGISFCARTTDHPRKFYLELVRVDNPLRPRNTEVYRYLVEVPTTWKQFVVPFKDLQLASGASRIKEGTAFAGSLSLRRIAGDFNCANDSGKVWFDSLRWLKPGEKASPVEQQLAKQARAN